jgi:hypothetical protein
MENIWRNMKENIQQHFVDIIKIYGVISKLDQRKIEQLKQTFDLAIEEIIQLTDNLYIIAASKF